jgi:hypothetical protein
MAPKVESRVEKMSDEELEREALASLEREFGAAGVSRLLLRLTTGSGDYTRDRDQWLKDVSMDEIFQGKRQFK